MVKQVVDFQKAMVDAGYNSLTILQGQGEQAMKRFLADISFVSDMTPFDMYLTMFKSERETMKLFIDEGFDMVKQAYF